MTKIQVNQAACTNHTQELLSSRRALKMRNKGINKPDVQVNIFNLSIPSFNNWYTAWVVNRAYVQQLTTRLVDLIA